MWWLPMALFFTIGIASAQSTTESSRKNLQRMRSSIESTRKRIDALQRRESLTARSLSTVQRQRQEVTRIVRGLENDVRVLQDSVSHLEQAIRSTTTARQRAEAAYGELAFASVKYNAEHRHTDYTEPGDAFILDRATQQMTQHRSAMRSRQDSLSSEQELLNSTSTEQEKLLDARTHESRRLTNTIASRKKELERIRGDKTLLLQELASKRSSANTLSSIIRKQEQNARQADKQRKQRAAAAAKKGSIARNEKNSRSSEGAGFAANSLPWPTQTRALIHGYGVYRNRETGTTLDNPGIDIRSPIGSRMTCVASGVVTSVTWLPGFGSLVIVDHKNGFRTVYANLTSVSVSIGSSVSSGTVIGSSGESLDGPTAHFEVWRGRERQNPLTYLR